jgi:hypothetical protein
MSVDTGYSLVKAKKAKQFIRFAVDYAFKTRKGILQTILLK